MLKYSCRAGAGAWVVLMALTGFGQDLDAVREAGVLRHLSIPYAHFDTGTGEGMDVELMRMFAAHLGVDYAYVQTEFGTVIGDLTGESVRPSGNDVEVLGAVPVRGDAAAHGFTVLAWREKVVSFSDPVFPTQVWLVAPAEAPYQPIVPTGSLAEDIAATRALIDGTTLMGKSGTCLDLSLFDVEQDGATGVDFEGSLNDLAPALLAGETDLLILDVPDALVALAKWPGRIKILGPMSEQQNMATAFRSESSALREAYNAFLSELKATGVYRQLILKYYPDAFSYFPDFFVH